MEIIRLHAFRDNYIWLLRQNGHVVAIDPGAAEPVLTYLAASGDRLHSILVTHHHGDHCDGIAQLAQGIPVYGPAAEGIAGVTEPLEGGERILLELTPQEPVAVTVLEVSGHTRGHLAYFVSSDQYNGTPALFCGDTLFTLGCGRIFEGTPAQMHAALAQVAHLPAATWVYCAHEYAVYNLPFALTVEPGNPALQERAKHLAACIEQQRPTVPFALSEALQTNPFLRCAIPEIIASASRHTGRTLADPVDIFAALRAWRNDF